MRLIHAEDNLRVVELPPQSRVVRLLEWDEDKQVWGHISKVLSFPYVQFVQTPVALYVSCSSRPIDDLNNIVGMFPLGNVYTNFEVCLGEENRSLTDATINSFWTTPFAYDDGWVGVALMQTNMGSLTKWEKNTAAINDYALTLDWNKFRGRPLMDLIKDAQLKNSIGK